MKLSIKLPGQCIKASLERQAQSFIPEALQIKYRSSIRRAPIKASVKEQWNAYFERSICTLVCSFVALDVKG
jgi:hypothetical protein